MDLNYNQTGVGSYISTTYPPTSTGIQSKTSTSSAARTSIVPPQNCIIRCSQVGINSPLITQEPYYLLWGNPEQSLKSFFQITTKDKSLPETGTATPHTSSQITFIRNQLDLRISDLAKICGVQRQTVYGWTNSEYFPEDEKAQRLLQIFKAAKKWQSLASFHIARMCQIKVEPWGSLMDVFCGKVINETGVNGILKNLSLSDLNSKQNAIRKTSLRDALQRHNLQYKVEQSTKDEIDLATGKIRSE